MPWLRARLATTPGRLIAISVVVGVVAIGFGTAAWFAERSREHAARAVRTQTEPLLAQAVNLYSALSDANATASTTFLTGGLEPATRRARYLADLRTATDSLSALTREVGNSPGARSAVATIANQVPSYSGLVEAARANNRQGFPVGAAYLRAASALLTTRILPAADGLYTIEAQRLSDNYDTGTSSTTLIVFAIAALLALAVLVVAQIYVAMMCRRIFNIPLLAATATVLGLSIWGLIGLTGEQNALAKAQRDGSDPVQVLSATRILASRAQSDSSLTLANRGSDEQDPLDLTAVRRSLRPLVTDVAVLDRRTGTTTAAQALAADFAAYDALQTRIDGLEQSGQIPEAIKVDVASEARGRSPADRITANLVAETAGSQARFGGSADDATSALDGLSIAIPVLTLLAVGLALFGLRQRINEYR